MQKNNDIIITYGEAIDIPYLENYNGGSIKNFMKEFCQDLLNLVVPITLIMGTVALVIFLFALI